MTSLKLSEVGVGFEQEQLLRATENSQFANNEGV
jgi:hypothetical protein